MATVHPVHDLEVSTLALRHILVTTDFSETSHKAMEQAAAIARLHGSDLAVLHIIPPEPILHSALEPATWEHHDLLARAKQEMQSFERSPAFAGIKLDLHVETGPLEMTLLDLIRQCDISMVVVATHGRSGIRKLILGSVAEEIFRIAPCPVLTIGPDVPPNLLTHGRFQSVLFATDFSEGSRHALPYASGFAQESQARLTLLHVLEEGSVSAAYLHEHLLANARKQLEEMLPAAANLTSSPDVEVVRGYPVEEILRAAHKHQADLIVLGVHKSSGLGARASAHLPWTIAQSVVSHANCPVLTVRG
ncbi:MAG TPA: universal stress protein [Terriglobales bacterium]|nr:universal stress protein [Terriglobales bacterium]